MTGSAPSLLADIGGTHTRLALSDGVGRYRAVEVVHTGDFGIEYAPVGGRRSDLGALARVGERGVQPRRRAVDGVALGHGAAPYTRMRRPCGVATNPASCSASARGVPKTLAPLTRSTRSDRSRARTTAATILG